MRLDVRDAVGSMAFIPGGRRPIATPIARRPLAGLVLSGLIAAQGIAQQDFVLFCLGTALAGSLAGSYSEQNEVGYFGTIGAVTLGVGLIVLAIAKPVRRGMRGVL